MYKGGYKGAWPAGKGPPTTLGKGGKPGGGNNAGIPAPTGSRATSQLELAHVCLPFGKKQRGAVEQRVRNPHRRCISEVFSKAIAHWADLPPGTARQLVEKYSPLEIEPSETVPPPESAGSPPANAVNVRAFLVSGVSPPGEGKDKDKHVLRRTEVLVNSSNTEGVRKMGAYGGMQKPQSDQQLAKALARTVAQQSGLDLSGARWHKLLELTYSDQRRTVFFVPDLSKVSTRVVKAQCQEEDETFEEEKEVEEEEEYEEGGETKKKTVKRKKTVQSTRTKKTRLCQPMKSNLATLRDYSVVQTTHVDTAELCHAADAFDEWLRRDTAQRITEVLGEKKVEAVRQQGERKKLEEARQANKRKREQAQEDLKQERLKKEADLREVWEIADEGKTDDEKREAEKERKQELQALLDEEKQKAAALLEAEQEANKAQAAAAAGQPPDAKRKKVTERDRAIFDLFQLFERPKSWTTQGILPRDLLVNTILCLDEERTPAEALDLTTLGGTVLKTAPVNYTLLSAVEKWVEVEEKPAEKEQPTETEKTEDKMEIDEVETVEGAE